MYVHCFKLFEFCKNLETFQVARYFWFHVPGRLYNLLGFNFKRRGQIDEIFNLKLHKKIRNLGVYFSTEESVQSVIKFVKKYNLKLINIPAARVCLLTDFDEVRARLLSLTDVSESFGFEGTSLPNVSKIEIIWNGKKSQQLTATMFPGLKTLHITLGIMNGSGQELANLWSQFPNLE